MPSTAPKCQHCHGSMHQTKRAERNMVLQLLGIVVFFLGLALAFAFIPIGTIIGIVLMLAALGMGYKKQKIWLCSNCGYFFPRQ